jgi:hypothetical protein
MYIYLPELHTMQRPLHGYRIGDLVGQPLFMMVPGPVEEGIPHNARMA